MDYKEYNDYELVYMVKEENEYYTEILFKKYQSIILKLSNKYYRQYKNYGYDYEDFYQEALVSFYKAINNYDNNRNVLLYTFIIVCINRGLLSFIRGITNKCVDLNSIYVDINENEFCIADPERDTNTMIDYNELGEIVKKVIFSLPMESGAILELKLNGFTYREIGTLLDIPTSSVEFKSRNARNILRKTVKAYYCK